MSGAKLAGKVAIVTGGTSGIGLETVMLFVRHGASVLFTGRRKELGVKIQKEVVEAHGNVALFLEADHTSPADCEKTVQTALQKFGRIDILFNNAGCVLLKDAETTTEEEFEEVLRVNVVAVWRMSRLVVPFMRKNVGEGADEYERETRGVIVNNASDWGLVGGPSAVAYCASKGAVVQMTKAMALDLAKDRIRVNAVCPGDTFVERWIERDRHMVTQPGEVLSEKEVEERLRVSQTIPWGRTGHTKEIAKGVLYLASSDSSFVTGTTLTIDGGNTAQ
eukprot:TRINITY_DN4177_c0_g1_i1.p1 TRINITY_DN4177_c0_g1~~TRINITY_DN4177_c0_g1_i1.p1  ORF type:complete len:278 (+),score=53.42 TRINITY_DN4177_c0_g1_i1:88-921(+)